MNPENELLVQGGAPFCTIRFVFSKTGRARFISHLDLNRAMIRAVRRARIPLWYTEGFNRHPYVTFAAPLSLGFEGLRESMDIRLVEEMPAEELVTRLNAVLPEGLRAVSAAPAVMKASALTAARYRLTFDQPSEAVAALLAQEHIEAEKRTKKKTTKIVDIKPSLTDAELTACDGGCQLTVTLPCGSDNTVNPTLLAAALSAAVGRDVAMTVLRLELYGLNGAVFC